MNTILILVVIAFLVQIAIFFFVKKKKRIVKATNSVFVKYNIKSKGDLFKIINSSNLPENDRIELEKLYSSDVSFDH